MRAAAGAPLQPRGAEGGRTRPGSAFRLERRVSCCSGRSKTTAPHMTSAAAPSTYCAGAEAWYGQRYSRVGVAKTAVAPPSPSIPHHEGGGGIQTPQVGESAPLITGSFLAAGSYRRRRQFRVAQWAATLVGGEDQGVHPLQASAKRPGPSKRADSMMTRASLHEQPAPAARGDFGKGEDVAVADLTDDGLDQRRASGRTRLTSTDPQPGHPRRRQKRRPKVAAPIQIMGRYSTALWEAIRTPMSSSSAGQWRRVPTTRRQLDVRGRLVPANESLRTA